MDWIEARISSCSCNVGELVAAVKVDVVVEAVEAAEDEELEDQLRSTCTCESSPAPEAASAAAAAAEADIIVMSPSTEGRCILIRSLGPPFP